MAHTAASKSLFCLQLQRGQTAWEMLPRAADITVTQGSIVVHQRLWVADTWVRLPVVLQTGEQFRVGAGGWIEMQATATARVHAMAALGWWHSGWLGRALRRLHSGARASWRPAA
ncbi:hypothetical protein [Ottowia thiooxydans]|uniref:DUF2917 domain-containing protein n=1 Tax=Ottowia thiooxydans TaxID=219182 RepID=A0ABV2Q7C7_9BURK